MAWSIFTDGGGDPVAVAWARQLLQQLGAPQTPGNIEFVYQWEKAEGGGGKYNPLNQGPVPGQPNLTTTGSQYGGGAADFASWAAGLQGAVDYLHMPNYTAVLSAIMSNNPPAARQALWNSPWAASHYGYGANWPNVPLPGNTQLATPIDFTGGIPSGNTGSTVSSSSSTETIGYNKNTCALGFDIPWLASLSGGIQPGAQGWKQLWDKLFGGGNKPSSTSIGICILSKTGARALIGGALIGSGGLVVMFGSVAILAYGLSRSGTARQVAQYVPLATRVIR